MFLNALPHGAWRVARGAWRVARGAWRVASGQVKKHTKPLARVNASQARRAGILHRLACPTTNCHLFKPYARSVSSWVGLEAAYGQTRLLDGVSCLIFDFGFFFFGKNPKMKQTCFFQNGCSAGLPPRFCKTLLLFSGKPLYKVLLSE